MTDTVHLIACSHEQNQVAPSGMVCENAARSDAAAGPRPAAEVFYRGKGTARPTAGFAISGLIGSADGAGESEKWGLEAGEGSAFGPIFVLTVGSQ